MEVYEIKETKNKQKYIYLKKKTKFNKGQYVTVEALDV